MKLILIRGLPGSGKSKLAETIKWLGFYAETANIGDHWYHFEADMYHIKNGVYDWKPENVVAAHAWCRGEADCALSQGGNVIVANTFTRLWEMNPYIEMAKKYKAELTVLTVEGNHGNVHDVPDEVIEKMRKRWEKYDG